MKFLITSDLHQRIAKWNDLVPAVDTERSRFVLIADHILPAYRRLWIQQF